MLPKHLSPRVFFPRTVSEALKLHNNENDAIFWAGGTYLASQSDSPIYINLPRNVVSLGLVEELARASRTETSLEVGSMMSLDRLAAIGRSALPAGIAQALSLIGTLPLRSQATLGGHLAVSGCIGHLVPLLQLLDTRIETRCIRGKKGRRKPSVAIRKIPLTQLFENDGLRRGELIVRLSIPTEPWSIGSVEEIQPEHNTGSCALLSTLLRVEKGVLLEWRLALSDHSAILRDRDLEVGMSGRTLPLTARELESVEEAVWRLTEPWKERRYERRAATAAARSILEKAVL